MDRWDLIGDIGNADVVPEPLPTLQITQVIVTDSSVTSLPDITNVPIMNDQPHRSPIRKYCGLIWRIVASIILVFLIIFLIALFVGDYQAISIKKRMLRSNIIMAEKLADIDKNKAMESIHETKNWITETDFSNEDREWLVDLEVFKYELETYSRALESGVHRVVPSKMEGFMSVWIIFGTVFGSIACIGIIIVIWECYE